MHSKQRIKTYFTQAVVLAVLVVFGLAAIVVPHVQADDYDAQINALRGENADVQSTVDKLAGEADTLQEEVNNLQSQINGLQAQINANVAKQNDLQKQIEDAQKELARQRALSRTQRPQRDTARAFGPKPVQPKPLAP